MMTKDTNTFPKASWMLCMLFSFSALRALAGESVSVNSLIFEPYQNADTSGFQNELVREAFSAAGLTANIKMRPPLRAVKEFYHSLDPVCADGETILDEEINKKLNIIKVAYWNAPIGLMYYKPNLTPEQIDSLNNIKSFADIDPALSILSLAGYFNIYINDGFKGSVLATANSTEQTMKMVKAGRNHLGFEVLGVTPYLVKQKFPQDINNWHFLNHWIFFPQEMAFNGKDPKGSYYAKKFSEGLSVIRKNGVYMSIYERYYGKHNIPKSAVHDPKHEISKADLAKTVDNDKFSIDTFLKQVRGSDGLITEFVD